MELNKKKQLIQNKAQESWLLSDKKGTVEIVTGGGKTFIALNALYTMPKNDDIHLFLAETKERERDLNKEILKYNKIFNCDVYKDYNLKFYCYQTVYKWEDKNLGLIISDEIHDSLTPSYCKFYINNNYKAIIGLSATIERSTKYKINGEFITKGEILDKIAPVCFKYTIDEGQNDGTSRKLNIYVIEHYLDSINKNIIAGNKYKQFKQTELAAYDYWNKQYEKAWDIQDYKLRSLKLKITATKRSNILYNLKSKINPARQILSILEGKTILFGNSIPILKQITPNVISSHNSDIENNRIRDDFENNIISEIGSFKKLKQGANMGNIDNNIIISYYSTVKDMIQRLGRLRDNGKIGNVFIFVTKETQEEIWFNKIFEDIKSFNMIYCKDINECINKLKKW